jgi:hypothetical protein
LQLLHRAGKIVHPNGATILRMSDNRAISGRFEATAARLARAA